ncbi:basement membrane-specific heparan sulfate proteoglycan core [Brachionus plicatilis]|uniref:Basement membrane-specific heparan sulfate proteoglycan core n=1 Tax=Brachionus plicatilis TaxID=10195 RepID=A0A3M7RU04_BRAPC|nr:basement membrane-specific heparan sulfate proteoglycan core [Brachionus plicatilis]
MGPKTPFRPYPKSKIGIKDGSKKPLWSLGVTRIFYLTQYSVSYHTCYNTQSLPRFKTIYGEPDNRLYLHYVSEADSGDYECYLPDGRSSMVHLNVRRQADKFISNELDYSYGTLDYINNDDQPKDTSPPTTKIPSSDSRAKKSIKSVDAELYSRVSLFCDLHSMFSTDPIQWKKINGSLSADSYSFHQELLISNVNEEDFGTYECSVRDGTDSIQRRELIQLNKKQGISSEQTDVAMIEQTSHYGQQVDLVCQPAELSDQVTWKRLDLEMPNERVEIYGNVLILNNVDPSDSGVYECIYGNDNKYRVKLAVDDLQETATTSHVSQPSNTPDLYDYYGFTEASRTQEAITTSHVSQPSNTPDLYDYYGFTEASRTQEAITTSHVSQPSNTPDLYDYYGFTEASSTQDSHHQQEPQLNIRSNFLNAKEGENIENVCSLTSNLDSSVIEWYNQYNEPVEKDERFQVYVEQSDSLTSLLRIYPARKEDSGRYECRVRGTSNVAVFDIEVHEQYQLVVLSIIESIIDNRLPTLNKGLSNQYVSGIKDASVATIYRTCFDPSELKIVPPSQLLANTTKDK